MSGLELRGEALALLRALEPAYRLQPNRLDSLRGLWLKGRLHRHFRDFEEAAVVLDEVRQGFLKESLAYDAALAGLDLAQVYAEQRELGRVGELAREVVPVFLAHDIPQEAAAALRLFEETARRHSADTAAISRLLAALEPGPPLGGSRLPRRP